MTDLLVSLALFEGIYVVCRLHTVYLLGEMSFLSGVFMESLFCFSPRLYMVNTVYFSIFSFILS